MALTLEEIDAIVHEAQPEILRRLDLNILLISELKRAGVMTDALSDILETKNLSRHEKISELLDSIRMGPVERFLCFCAVLHRCEQEHILGVINVDFNSIKAQRDSLYGKSSFEELDKTGSHSGNLFPEQCEYYETKLALSPIYEYVSRSPLVHLDEMFTNLWLVDNEKDQCRSKCSSKGEDIKPIQLKDIFDPKDKQVLSIIIEGRPGNGKSTLLRHCAVDWARRKKERPVSCVKDFPLSDKDLLIFVDKNDEGDTLDETILNAIKGDKKIKAESFAYMKKYPKKTFLFFDGLDEFLRQSIRNEILKLAKDCGINIVVSCRLGHPYLQNKMTSFNRHVRIEGFGPDSKEMFVKSFMKVLGREKNDESLEQKSETLCTLLKKQDTQNVYTTPMNCTFLCILYAEGQVADEELSSLTMRDLYMRQQDLLLKREFIKTLYSNEQKSRESEAATIQGIYKMALHSLIHRKKQSRYSAEDAEKFGIDLNSPAMVMLQIEQDGPRKMLQWPHQTIKEFHAANAARNPTIMYLVASKQELNEVTSFIVSSLIKSDPGFVKELLTAALILRSTDPTCLQSKFKQIRNMFSKHACMEIPKVKQYLKEQDIEELLRKDTEGAASAVLIPRIDQIQACLRGGDWLIRNENILQGLRYIVEGCQSSFDCLQCLAHAVHPFLPSSWSGYHREELDAELSQGQISSNQTIAEGFRSIVPKLLCSYGVCLSPVAGSDIYCKITYTNPGLVSKFSEWRNSKNSNDSDDNSNDDDDQFNVAKHNTFDMNMCNLKDALADVSHPYILQFSKSCGSVDFVLIYVHEDTGPADTGRWFSLLTQLKAVVRPKIGIIIHDTKLTKDDTVKMGERLKINVRQDKMMDLLKGNC